MSTISLNMIVKNEEKFLDGCLNSIRDLVDEIVIADTGSVDRTLEIAKNFGAKILYFKWKNDFAAARNYVLANSTCEWILYLDADERIEKLFHQRIKEMVITENVEAYLLKLRSLIKNETYDQVQIVPYPRLFRRTKGLKFEGRIHEQITPSLVRAGARFKSSEVIIEHLGYAQDPLIMESKKQRNLNALIRITEEEPQNAYAFYQLGQNYIIFNENEKGVESLKKALDLGTLTIPVAASAYAALAQHYNQTHNYIEAEKFCSKSLEIAPNQLFGRLLFAEILLNNSKTGLAIEHLQKSLDYIKIPEHLRKSETAVDVSYDASFIYYKFGIAYLNLQNVHIAEDYFLKSIRSNEQFMESLIELANINFKKGNFDVSVDYLNKIDLKKIRNSSTAMNIAGLYEEMKKYNECANVLEYVINLDPQNAKAYFFLGNCYLFTNNFEKAQYNFIKSHEIAPKVKETIQNLAVVYIKTKNYEKALNEYLKLEKLFPGDEDIKRKIQAFRLRLGLI